LHLVIPENQSHTWESCPMKPSRIPRLAGILRWILSSQVKGVIRLVEGDHYQEALSMLHTIEIHIASWVVDPWKNNLIEKVNLVTVILESP